MGFLRKKREDEAASQPTAPAKEGPRDQFMRAIQAAGLAKLVVAAAAAAFVVQKLTSVGKVKRRRRRRRKQPLGYKIMEDPAVDYQPLNPRWLESAVALAETGHPPEADLPVCPALKEFREGVASRGGAFVCEGGAEARRELFLLEQGALRYLNHGSYGACFKLCRQVQDWYQARLEAQPVRFMEAQMLPALVDARDRVAEFVGSRPADMVCVQNATAAINAVLKSFRPKLRPGDLLMMTSLTYPAVRSTLAEAASAAGAGLVEVQLPASCLHDRPLLHRHFRRALDRCKGRVKLAVLDHVTSFPPVVFDVKALTALCRRHGAKVLVDGSHAVGSVPLNIPAIRCHYYTSNLHKWLCTPKGAALLWVAPEEQVHVRPLVTSHGYRLGFQGEFLWQGTRDDSAWLAAPAALEVLDAMGGPDRVRRYNAATVRGAVDALEEAFGPRQVFGLQWDHACMAVLDLPPLTGCPPSPQAAFDLHEALRTEFDIEVPVVYWNSRLWVRVSAQLYNSPDDYAALADALRALGATDVSLPGTAWLAGHDDDTVALRGDKGAAAANGGAQRSRSSRGGGAAGGVQESGDEADVEEEKEEEGSEFESDEGDDDDEEEDEWDEEEEEEEGQQI